MQRTIQNYPITRALSSGLSLKQAIILGSIGDALADIYFGEFMRIFDHLYSRYIVGKMKELGKHDPNAGFLKEKAKDWVPQNFIPGRKDSQRRYFMGG